jgi:hypothetical protein
MASMTIFTNEMEDGKLSADGFKEKVAKLREEGLKALNKRLEDGTDSMAKYEKGMKSLGLIFDSFKPKKDIEIKVARPAWLENIVNEITPLEKYKQGIADLNANMANLTPEQLGKGAKFLTDELEKSVGAMEELKNPGALMQGSSAAFSQVLKIQNANGSESAAERSLRVQQQALEQQRVATEYAKATAAGVANQNQMNLVQF